MFPRDDTLIKSGVAGSRGVATIDDRRIKHTETIASIAWVELENRTLKAFLKQMVEVMAFVFGFRKVRFSG